MTGAAGTSHRVPGYAGDSGAGHRRVQRVPWLLLLAVLWIPLLASGACERKAAPGAEAQAVTPGSLPAASPTAPPPAEVPVVLCLGDSLTAGFGLPQDQSYPSLLQQRLRDGGYPHRVVNAGVSGDTSAGGLARLDWLLRQRVDVMILALGGNDGLRALSTQALESNLSQIIERAQARGIRILLAGMRMPANYGADYQRRFAAVYPALAKRHGVSLLPFLLEGVAGDTSLNQPDGIHPTAEGARKVSETVWNSLKPLL